MLYTFTYLFVSQRQEPTNAASLLCYFQNIFRTFLASLASNQTMHSMLHDCLTKWLLPRSQVFAPDHLLGRESSKAIVIHACMKNTEHIE